MSHSDPCLERPFNEQVVLWFDQLAAQHRADGYSLFKLYLRFLNYYSVRMPDFRVEPGELRWRGSCAVCPGEVDIETMSGWWLCHGCGRQGEVYAYEYLRHGGDDPSCWDACRERADALMVGAGSPDEQVAG